jgi:hypothetical protein
VVVGHDGHRLDACTHEVVHQHRLDLCLARLEVISREKDLMLLC